LGAAVTVVDILIPDYGGNLYNLERLHGRVKINVSDVRDTHSLRHLVLGQVTWLTSPAERRAIDIGDYYSDYSKFKGQLGWEPKRTLRETIESTLRFFENLPHYL
jgi:nucleoside-diphosphate-sugar epimerase